MNCSRTDYRRQIDFSAVKNADSLTHAIQALLSRRRNPMSENEIAKWFRGTPPAFVCVQLAIAVGRGQIQTVHAIGRRGVAKYWVNGEWE